MEISVVIPVYNSEKTISDVVLKIKKILDKRIFEIILVNDGSKDNSYNICKKLVENNSEVKFINLSKNFGQHNALMAGYNIAGGEYILSMDDDLQTSPEEILKLIEKIKSSTSDVVYAQYPEKKHNKFRNFGTWINDLMAKLFIGKNDNFVITSFFIMKKYVKDELIEYEGPYPYLAGLILRVTQNVGTVDVIHKERKIGKSNYTLTKLLRLMLNGFTNFSVKPLRIASIVGIIISMSSVFGAFYILIKKMLFSEYILLGWSSLMILLFFSLGIQLIFLGLIGEYVGRIFLSLNKQPQYVIKEIFKRGN